MEGIRISSQRRDGFAVVTVSGELDIVTSRRFDDDVVGVPAHLGQALVEPAARHDVELAADHDNREPVPPLRRDADSFHLHPRMSAQDR